MNTTQLEERFEKIGIVPVVVLDDDFVVLG